MEQETAEIIKALSRLEAHMDIVMDLVKKQNGRVAWLEKKVNYAGGIFATITAILFAAWDKIKL